MRTIGVVCGLMAAVSCTRDNPAYEGGGGTELATGAAEGSGPGTNDGLEAGPAGGEGSGVETLTSGNGETTSVGETSAGETSVGETEDTGPDDPPQVGPYGRPELVGAVNDPLAPDDDPTLPDDMLELFFATQRGTTGEDIWVSRRASLVEPWGVPEPVEELRTLHRENTPEISLDGLRMMLASDRELPGQEDVYLTTRPDRDSPWTTPVRVAELSTPDRDACPFPTADGLHVYACVGPGAQQDIVRFDLDRRTRAWATPVSVAELNTPAIECGAWLDPSQRVMAFVSDRAGGAGNADLWVAARDDEDQPFAVEGPLAELNTPVLEDDPWVSSNGDTIYFTSNRAGSMDLYVATRVE